MDSITNQDGLQDEQEYGVDKAESNHHLVVRASPNTPAHIIESLCDGNNDAGAYLGEKL